MQISWKFLWLVVGLTRKKYTYSFKDKHESARRGFGFITTARRKFRFKTFVFIAILLVGKIIWM